MAESTLNSAYAVQFGEIQYNNTFIDYSKINPVSTRKLADFYFNKALTESDKDIKSDYLVQAAGEYFILTQINRNDLYPIIQMARIYDLEDKNSYSKAYFFEALKIERENPQTNYYFGEYYYKRKDYSRALFFFKRAEQYGYNGNKDLWLEMAVIYEKLGDLAQAYNYYKKALSINPKNSEILNRMNLINALNYGSTGYYKKYTYGD